jgi:F5/8 type C domain
LSELAAYSAGAKLGGRVFSPKKPVANDPFGADKAVDGNLATTFRSDGFSSYSSWVGLDFGKPVSIDSIRFASGQHTREGDMNIVPGHTYQLKIWNNSQWTTVSVQTAKQRRLTFERVPSNALYLLHDSSATVDERIFTYENNAIAWF